MEANLLGIKEIQKSIDEYIKDWKINEKSLHIIINKNNRFSINKQLISKIIAIKNSVNIIKENKKISFYIKSFYERKNILKNRNIKKQINDIINLIK